MRRKSRQKILDGGAAAIRLNTRLVLFLHKILWASLLAQFGIHGEYFSHFLVQIKGELYYCLLISFRVNANNIRSSPHPKRHVFGLLSFTFSGFDFNGLDFRFISVINFPSSKHRQKISNYPVEYLRVTASRFIMF